MAVKTFTTGEVLTASDTNTYLNNGGLVYISGTTVGTGVSSVTVSSAFSSTYDNYRVIINNVDASADAVGLRFDVDKAAIVQIRVGVGCGKNFAGSECFDCH